MSNLEFPPKY